MAPSLLLAPPPSPSSPFDFLPPPAIQTSTTSTTSSSTPVPFDPLSASFRPSIAVIIGVLTTMFSLTFLLLLYAKHCKRAAAGALANAAGSHDQQAGMNTAPPPPPLRGRDSGVDRTVIDALPVFSFASLHGLKDGLECAVCLSRFEKLDLLRLLPKCKHAFHIECVDTWLGSHSTCPLCRNRVEPEDVLIVEEFFNGGKIQVAAGQEQERQSSARASNYIAGRISSAGSDAGIDRTLQLFVERERDPSAVAACASFRLGRSFSWKNEPSFRKDGDCGKKDRPLALPISTAIADKDLDAQFARRLWHRIIVSDVMFQHRWSDFMPSDTLFLDTQAAQADQHLPFLIGLDHRLMMIKVNGDAQRRLSTSRNAGDGRMEVPSQNCTSSSYHQNTGDGRQAPAIAGVASVIDDEPAMSLEMELISTANQPPEGGHINSSERQAGLLKRALAAGMVRGGSRRTDSEATLLLMPTRYPRSLSEVSGMKRYADSYADSHHISIAGAGKTRDDEETKKWLSIARKTLTWLTRQERSRLSSSTPSAF